MEFAQKNFVYNSLKQVKRNRPCIANYNKKSHIGHIRKTVYLVNFDALIGLKFHRKSQLDLEDGSVNAAKKPLSEP